MDNLDGLFKQIKDIVPKIKEIVPKAIDETKIFIELMRDEKVPWRIRSIPLITAIAAIAVWRNANIIPDNVPGIGELDDEALGIGTGYLGWRIFMETVPEDAWERAREKAGVVTRNSKETKTVNNTVKQEEEIKFTTKSGSTVV